MDYIIEKHFRPDNVIIERGMMWNAEFQLGFLPLDAPADEVYDKAYFENYERLQHTSIGHALNDARTALVNAHTDGKIIDIGVGSGQFVHGRPNTFGYDINPVAVQMLKKEGRWLDPNSYRTSVVGLTFWDSLEHIEKPSPILGAADRFVFVSCPIYKDLEHVLRSKHFKPNEHCWYWTEESLKWFMKQYDFQVIDQNRMESDIGREDIGSFVFVRVD